MTTAELFVEIVGWSGAFLILLAYLLISMGRLTGQSVVYQAMNLVGAAGFVINGWWHGALPSASLNVVWGLIAAVALWRIWKRVNEAPQTAPVPPPLPVPASPEVIEALSRRYVGSLAPGRVSPRQAVALAKLGLLTPDAIGDLAGSWLERRLDRGSSELAALALNPPAVIAEARPALACALAEMGVEPLSHKEAVLTALDVYLDAIAERVLPGPAAMAAIRKIDEARGDAVLHHPNREPDRTEAYQGQELALEQLYGWEREFSDLLDGTTFYHLDLPPLEQLARFDEEMIEEARIVRDHLRETHPEVRG